MFFGKISRSEWVKRTASGILENNGTHFFVSIFRCSRDFSLESWWSWFISARRFFQFTNTRKNHWNRRDLVVLTIKEQIPTCKLSALFFKFLMVLLWIISSNMKTFTLHFICGNHFIHARDQHFQIPIRSGTHGHVSTSSYELLSAPWVNKLQFTIFNFFTKNYFQIPIRSGTHGHVSTSSYELLSAPWVNKLQFTIFFFYKKLQFFYLCVLWGSVIAGHYWGGIKDFCRWLPVQLCTAFHDIH